MLDVEPSSAICSIPPFSLASKCADSLVYLPGDSSGVADPENVYLVDPLFVFLPGTAEIPADYKQILRMAAFAGYRTVGLSYHNTNTLEDQCLSVEAHPECEGYYFEECMYEMRWERLTGEDDPYTNNAQVVLEEDSIAYRLVEVLAEAAAWDTGDDWGFDSYCTDGGGCAAGLSNGSAPWSLEIDWERVVLAGFSQGAGYGEWLSLHGELAGIACIDGSNDICCIDTDSPANGCQEDEYQEASYFPELVDLWSQDGGGSPDDEEFGAIHEEHPFVGAASVGDVPLSYPYVELSETVEEVDNGAGYPPLSYNVARTSQNWPTDCGYHSSMAVDDCMPTHATFTATPASNVLTSTFTPDLHLFKAYVEGFCGVVEGIPLP